MGVKHNKGLSGGLPVETLTESTTSHSTILCGTESANCGGGEGTSGQRSHNRSPQPSGRVLFKYIPSPKEGRRSETGDKPEGSEQFCSHRALQNGGNSHPQRPRQSGGLASESGFEGRLLCDPNPQDAPSVSQVLLSEQMLSVSVPSIWPVISSVGLYQDPKASTSPPPGDGGTTDSLYRRYPGPGRVTGTSQDASGGTSIPPAVLRFQSKPKEVSIRASPSDGILGLYCRYSSDGAEAPRGKNKKDPCGITGIITRGTSLRQSPGSTGGEDECNITSYSPSSSVLPPSSDGSIRVPECTLSVLRGTSSPDTGMQGGTDMVGHPHDKLEWKVPSEEGSGHNNRLRCLTDGLGSNQSEPEDRRSMVTGREQYAHQLPGVAGSNIGSEDIPEKQNQDVNAPQVGQYHGSGIHKQPGGDSLQGIGRLSKGLMDVVPGKEHPHHSPTPTRCSECDSRCGVSDYDRQVRLAAKPSHIRQDCRPVRSSESGPVCLTSDRTMPSLFQLAARSLCSGNRSLSAGLVSDQGVCQPPMEPDRPSSVQSTDGEGTDCASGTCLEDTAMVSIATANVNCSSTSDLSRSGDAVQGSGGSRPSASRVAYLRERYRDQELSEEAASLMLKSWRTKTNKSYDSLFGKWHSWCCARGSDPFSGPIKEVVNFLANLHKEGYQHRSLNAYCSAISSVHERVDGFTVGQHPLVTRLMKGVFNDRPPLPRYTCTWNVQTVLTCISSWGSNDSLSLKQLSWKTTMLLALTRPSRSADLSQLSLSGKQYRPNGVTFKPSGLAKQSRQGKPLTEFFLPFIST